MIYDFVELDKEIPIPMYQQLYKSISIAIENGNLPQGTKLPSIRKFSEDLTLSRTTVESAYQQLCVEGFIINRPRKGYFVHVDGRLASTQHLDKNRPYVSGNNESPIRYDLGSDSIDSSTADIKLWRSHIKDVLKKQNIIISYGEPQGEYELRRIVSLYSYAVRGVTCSEDNIVIGAGTQPLLYLLCGLLKNDGMTAAIEKGGFSKAEQVFVDCHFDIAHIHGNTEGIDIDSLYQTKASVLFVNPSGNLITGQPMKIKQRYELLNWAHQCDGMIIEDDYNGELRFTSRPIPALQGMDSSRVIYIGSFSKLLLPSVRIGYMVLPPRLMELYRAKSSLYNQTASKIEQLALAKYIREGQLDKQLRRLRKIYAEKSSLLITALKNTFGEQVRIILHESSLSVTLILDDNGCDIETLARKAGLKVRHIKAKRTTDYALRLGFSGIPIQDIVPAVELLYHIYHS
ncbi:MAG: PLP-dependent aminotransferase family protein [Clostridia bacterium]|nr:PLP-dependent aminotransferase family protein [Clostridia bacterium]